MYQVKAVTAKATTSYYSGSRKEIRGYHVVLNGAGLVRRFMQGSAQKWTPALDQELRGKAEEWARVLNERAAA
jgi:hypothetical protein